MSREPEEREPEAPAEGAEPRPDAPRFRRLPGETAKAWEGFCIYVELGPNRSLRRVAERLNKSETVVAEWSGKWDWVERAAGVDEAVARARHEERVRVEKAQERKRLHRLDKLRRADYDIGLRIRRRALQMLDWPLEETVKDETTISEDGQIITRTIITRPVKWTFRDALVAAETADRLIRLGLGIEAADRGITSPGDTHFNLTVNVGRDPAARLQGAVKHLQNLRADRERYIDRLASAEPERPRRELEEYVDRMLVEWTAEDWRVPAARLLEADVEEDGGDPLLSAINITPGRED